MSRKHLIALGLAAFSALTPGLSHAVCNLNGVIVRVLSYDDGYTAVAGYIYFRTSSLAPYYYYTTTNDDDMISNAIEHMNSGRTLNISGNGPCPATPAAGGSATIGTLNYFFNP